MSDVMKFFTRGGQTLLHRYRMLGQVLRLLLITFIGVSLLVTLGLFYLRTSSYERYIYRIWYEASLLSHLGQASRVSMRQPDGEIYPIKVNRILRSPVMKTLHQATNDTLKHCLALGLGIGVLSLLLVYIQLILRGKQLEKPQLVQGRYLGKKRELVKKIKQLGPTSSIKIAGVPLPKDAETQHFFYHGIPGSGKSVALRSLLDQVKARGDKAIIYDRHGEFVQYYYDPEHDKLLNPLDKRCESWDLWAECQEAADFDHLAAALMPMPLGGGSDPFWINAARTLFSTGGYQLRTDPMRSTEKLLRMLLMSDSSTLFELLKNTEAESLVAEKAEKQALSIKSVLATYVKSFKYLHREGPAFSIKQWLQEEGDGWLFVTSRADKHESIKPLISVWLDLVANHLMALSPSSKRRIWTFLDELPSLQRLPSLPKTFAESRKFGGCIAAGVQNYFQLQKLYGQDGAKEIVDLCNTRLFLTASSHDSAQWVSRELGQSEVIEVREGISYGANTIRDGVSMSHQRLTKPAVSSSAIMNLPVLQGYLSISPGRSAKRQSAKIVKQWPIVQVSLKINHNKTLQQPAFIPQPLSAVSPDLEKKMTTLETLFSPEGLVKTSQQTASHAPLSMTNEFEL